MTGESNNAVVNEIMSKPKLIEDLLAQFGNISVAMLGYKLRDLEQQLDKLKVTTTDKIQDLKRENEELRKACRELQTRVNSRIEILETKLERKES